MPSSSSSHRCSRVFWSDASAPAVKGYVIGSPVDPSKPWDYGNRNGAAADLYRRVAEKLGITMMLCKRSHVWRTTLRSQFEGRVSRAVLNSQFGHSEKTAQRHCTDPRDLSSLVDAARRPAT